jgi:hypothetical protein
VSRFRRTIVLDARKVGRSERLQRKAEGIDGVIVDVERHAGRVLDAAIEPARSVPDAAAITRRMRDLALESQFRRERAREVAAERRRKLIHEGLARLSREYFEGEL